MTEVSASQTNYNNGTPTRCAVGEAADRAGRFVYVRQTFTALNVPKSFPFVKHRIAENLPVEAKFSGGLSGRPAPTDGLSKVRYTFYSSAKQTHQSFTIHYSLFTIHHSLFTIHCSPFTVHHSLFTIHHSLFTVHCLLDAPGGNL